MKNFLKLLITLFIIFLLLKFNVIDFSGIKNISHNYKYILYILFLMVITMPLGALRWWSLLKSERYNISYWNAYLLYSTGLFFNIFMPGGAGGDIAKGYYLFKHVEKNQRILAIFTILVDRVVGLHALLFTISLFGIIISEKIFFNSDLHKLFNIILIIMIVSVPAILIVINYSGLIKKYIEKRKSIFLGNIAYEIFSSLEIYKNRKFVLFKCWSLSLVNHFCLLSCFYITSIFLNINIFDYFEAAFIGGVSLITNAVPLTPGGIGIGESTFNYLSQFFYNNQNIAFGSIFFITVRVLFNFICLSGAISFVIIKKPENLYKKI